MSRRQPGIVFLLLFICLPAALRAGNGATFLVVEHPERLVAYDRYQQQATEEERGSFLPFVPMRILKSDGLLPDGFTHCMQVVVDGETFFLLLDKRGRLATSGPPGIEQRFRNATALGDTLEVLKDRAVRFSPMNSPATFLNQGDRVAGVFRYQDRVFGLRMGEKPVYGWADRTGGGEAGWRVIASTAVRPKSSTPIPPGILEKVRARIGEINRQLARLYEHFNRQTHQQKAAPYWDIQVARGSIACVLKGASGGERFDRSTLYLVKDIENIILGANLAVTQSEGRIDIRQQ